jgi:hypothetical protein
MEFLKAFKMVMISIFIIVILLVCINILYSPPLPKDENYPLQDTVYNRVVIDSIVYNIIEKDSVIYKIKTKIKEDEERIVALDDSATVALFYELAAGTSSNSSN